MERILIIEDEADLAATLKYSLTREGFDAVTAETGAAALEEALGPTTPSLVLLDLQLPDMPGVEVCRRLRADPRTRAVPIIMVTAKTDEIDRVVGFEVGADDYVAKPFSVRELLLRIRAVLRRTRPDEAAPATTQRVTVPDMPAFSAQKLNEVRDVGRLRLDIGAHKVWVDQRQIQLTALEFKLLQTFAERLERVQTREQLLSDVWGIDADITTRTVDTHVKRLRDKLGAVGSYIETIRGVGYRFQLEPDDG